MACGAVQERGVDNKQSLQTPQRENAVAAPHTANKLAVLVYAVEHQAVVLECVPPKRPAKEPYRQLEGTEVDAAALP